ncbi:MAG: hypothetical protein HY304_03680 [candidate division Zixibacteria bacterium]|nr:hypothetical protein [candidate division Zixibacteria bacterium]
MNSTYAQLTGRRAWFVPAISVWGNLQAETLDSVATEIDDGATRVAFQRFIIGGAIQEIPFASLTDHRGNGLPVTIDHPVVIPVGKNDVTVAVVGQSGTTSFRVGKTAITAQDGIIDLWIIEAK